MVALLLLDFMELHSIGGSLLAMVGLDYFVYVVTAGKVILVREQLLMGFLLLVGLLAGDHRDQVLDVICIQGV